jgi:peptidoglycan hydrolase-like protein with peptidoglycan-binding domain
MDPSATAGNPAMNNNNNSFQGGSKQASMSQSDIQQAQQQLKSQGLYRGAVDGILGPQTEQALSQFQQQNGLPQTADLDQQTMSRLMGGSSQQGMQQQPMQPQAMPQQNQAIPGSAANPLPANQAR